MRAAHSLLPQADAKAQGRSVILSVLHLDAFTAEICICTGIAVEWV